jgi:hypothetical protein
LAAFYYLSPPPLCLYTIHHKLKLFFSTVVYNTSQDEVVVGALEILEVVAGALEILEVVGRMLKILEKSWKSITS